MERSNCIIEDHTQICLSSQEAKKSQVFQITSLQFPRAYLRLLRKWTGQVLRRQLSRAYSGSFSFSFPKWRREGGVAGEEKGSGRKNNLLN